MLEVPEWISELADIAISWCTPDGDLQDDAPEEAKEAMEKVLEFMAPMEGFM